MQGVTLEDLLPEINRLVHSDRQEEAAKLVGGLSKLTEKESLENRDEILFGVLHWLLNEDRYAEAAQLLWTPNMFDPRPRFSQLAFQAFKDNSFILFQGSASTSKSFSAGVWLLLDWIRDPQYTSIRLVGPSEDHLKSNLFTHLVTLHRAASLPLPGYEGDLFIGLDRKEMKSSITGLVIPQGTKGSGKLQGTKRVPRPKPHPKFGKLTRLRIFIDELEKVPRSVFKDLDNLFGSFDGGDSLKIAGAYNPEDRNGPVGERAEPVDGWELGFDLETSEAWKSARGWQVVRFDGQKCENVVHNKRIYPGLQTREGLEKLKLSCGGETAPSWFTYGRGAFPDSGTTFSVIRSNLLVGISGDYIFVERPTNVASTDVALEGGDVPQMAFGRWGRAVGFQFPASAAHPKGLTTMFEKPRWALQLDDLISLPAGDTVAVANNIKSKALSRSVMPGWVLLDRTGNGAGVHDLIKSIWSTEVRGVNYTESATDRKIFSEDTQTAKEAFGGSGRIVSELWFALQMFLEFKMIGISPSVSTEKLFHQLQNRYYRAGRSRQVESKREYKAREGHSPDEADAFTLLLHCARVASGVVPSMGLGTRAAGATPAGQPVPYTVDITNRMDSLD